MTLQRDVFRNGEGDAFFHRNRPQLSGEDASPQTACFSRYSKRGDPVLEIGCANGAKLAALTRLTGCEGFGVDPSRDAIADGRRRFPNLSLEVATAEQLPFHDEQFRMVILGFFLYLVDRTLLFRTLAEADRVLADDGFLGITDFYPDRPTARPYKHNTEVTTWKADYVAPFLALPSYVLAEQFTWSHSDQSAYTADPGERIVTAVLHKRQKSAYW